MKVEIDQSGKIEDTQKLTIVACANGKVKSIKISAKEKRVLIKIMRELEFPQTVWIYKIFAVLIFLLIKNESNFTQIYIDIEYPGHNALIKKILMWLFESNGYKTPDIVFGLVGKQSLAHKIAIETFRGKRKADLIVEKEDVLKFLYK